MRTTIAAALLASVLTATGEAQAQDPYTTYRTAVATYGKTGDISRAVLALQNWSGSDFDAATKAAMAARIPGELKTAAIFHLEIAVALVGVSTGVARGHINYGENLLDRWSATQPRFRPAAGDEEKRFRARWFEVAASAFASVKDLGRARPLLSKAGGIQQRSARIQTLIGTLKEFDAMQFNPEDGPTISTRGRLQRERILRLYQAELDYQQALRFDKDYALAHIRIGRVQHLTGKLREARVTLERGRTLASEPQSQYLAALFLGALQQDQHDIEGARRSFEEAVALAPGSQPAVVALAHLELMAGRPDRANALARSLAERPITAEPWWAFHNGGLDLSGLRWLREQATQ